MKLNKRRPTTPPAKTTKQCKQVYITLEPYEWDQLESLRDKTGSYSEAIRHLLEKP